MTIDAGDQPDNDPLTHFLLNGDLRNNLMTQTVMVNSVNLNSHGINLRNVLHNIELNIIKEALNISNGIVSHAAQKLGMRRTTLVEKMKKFNIVK